MYDIGEEHWLFEITIVTDQEIESKHWFAAENLDEVIEAAREHFGDGVSIIGAVQKATLIIVFGKVETAP